MKKVIVKAISHPKETILNKFLVKLGDLIEEMFDPDFILTLRSIKQSEKLEQTCSNGYKEYKYLLKNDLDLDFVDELNRIENQERFEKIGIIPTYSDDRILKVLVLS